MGVGGRNREETKMNEVTLLGLVSCLGTKTQVSIHFPKKKKTEQKTAQEWFLELCENDTRASLVVTKIDVLGYGFIDVEVYYA